MKQLYLLLLRNNGIFNCYEATVFVTVKK